MGDFHPREEGWARGHAGAAEVTARRPASCRGHICHGEGRLAGPGAAVCVPVTVFGKVCRPHLECSLTVCQRCRGGSLCSQGGTRPGLGADTAPSVRESRRGSRPRLSGVGETRVALEKNVGSGPLLADRTASVPRRGAEKCTSPRRPVPVALNSPRQGAKMVPHLGRCSGGPGRASKLRPAHAHACQAGFRSCRFVSGGWWWRSGVLPCPVAWEEEEKQVLI